MYKKKKSYLYNKNYKGILRYKDYNKKFQI